MSEDDKRLVQAAIRAVGRSPVEIVEEIEQGVRAGMNPYCLSTPEEYVLNVITAIRNELREAGY